jgi:hypothetical protein
MPKALLNRVIEIVEGLSTSAMLQAPKIDKMPNGSRRNNAI